MTKGIRCILVLHDYLLKSDNNKGLSFRQNHMPLNLTEKTEIQIDRKYCQWLKIILIFGDLSTCTTYTSKEMNPEFQKDCYCVPVADSC